MYKEKLKNCKEKLMNSRFELQCEAEEIAFWILKLC